MNEKQQLDLFTNLEEEGEVIKIGLTSSEDAVTLPANTSPMDEYTLKGEELFNLWKNSHSRPERIINFNDMVPESRDGWCKFAQKVDIKG